LQFIASQLILKDVRSSAIRQTSPESIILWFSRRGTFKSSGFCGHTVGLSPAYFQTKNQQPDQALTQFHRKQSTQKCGLLPNILVMHGILPWRIFYGSVQGCVDGINDRTGQRHGICEASAEK
jgi:hypothetical protein